MSKSYDQHLSQLLDNDLERGDELALLSDMQKQPDLQAKLRRYALIQQAMKAQNTVVADDDFLARVKHQMHSEPVYLMPQLQPKKDRRKLAGLALAASVAMMAIVIPLSMKISSLEKALQAQTGQQLATAQEQQNEMVRMYPVNRRFQDYLQAHNSSVYTSGATNLQPHMNLVGYELQ